MNVAAEKDGESVYIRRLAAPVPIATTPGTLPRGMVDINGTLVVAFANAIVRIANGNVAVLTGLLPGTDGVTFARNNRVANGVSSPDILAVREGGGTYAVNLGDLTVVPFADPDLPYNANSVDFLGGFFLWSIPDGRIVASGLNTGAVDALSFATAESRADGLLRGIVAAGTFYAMGSSTIEPWQNAGNSPFPLARHTSIIPVGILTTMAVAGFEEGWDLEPLFVAQDGTVRRLAGFDAPRVSTAAVERFIAASTVSTIECCVYTHRGRAFWVVSSDAGSWEFDVVGGVWHERVSPVLARWRVSRSVKTGGRWLFGDRAANSGAILALSDTTFEPLTVESGPLKDFPARIAIPSLFADMASAQAANVLISWSHDGGRTWSAPVERTIEPGRKTIRVNRLGLSSHHGLRVRFTVASTSVDVSLLGASVPDPRGRAA